MLAAKTIHGTPQSSAATITRVLLGLWLAAVAVLAASDAFHGRPGDPPLPLLLGVAIPLAAFVLLYRIRDDFREFVLGFDLSFITSLHAWRFVGFGFLALSTQNLLPGYFAWPAALGDLAIAVSAPWMAMALAREPGFARRPVFLAWNLFGLADFAVALGTGVLGSGAVPGLSHSVTTELMSRLPLVLVPTFFVPLFTLLHLAAIAQARSARALAR